MITRTLTISPDATFAELQQVTLAEWERMPTLNSGQFDNLKYESETFRVWVSRLTLKDYDGDAEAHMNDRFTIEKLIDGRWVPLDRYGRVRT